jgi:hypothetical protein
MKTRGKLSCISYKTTRQSRTVYKLIKNIKESKSKKNRQHNGQKKEYKRTNNDQQNIHIKLKIELHEPH